MKRQRLLKIRRTIVDSAIPEVLAGVAGAAVGFAGSFTALWALGTSKLLCLEALLLIVFMFNLLLYSPFNFLSR